VRTIETRAVVSPDGTLTVQLPPDIPPGEHQVVVVIEERANGTEQPALEGFPVDDLGPWPEGLSLRREDMYDDWGR
jgi:hypothetical protein